MKAHVALVLGSLLPAVLFGGCNRCNPDKDPEPLPEASTTTTTPETSLEVEDAGEDVEDAAADADADAKKPVGVPAANLKACCQALSQNAASAPPPTNLYMQQAAAACLAAVAQGKDKSTITGIVAGALKGAGMPAACR
jgi:hypothetical protein